MGFSIAPGVTKLTGTANQVTVSPTAGTGSVTLSLPQSIHTGASPTFAGLTLSSPLTPANGGTGVISFEQYGVLYGNDVGNVLVTAVGAANSALIGNGAGSPPSFSTAPTLTGLTVTNAPTFSAMTAGSMLFAGAAGLLSQDNSNLYWDDSTNRLGLGTTAPTSILSLTGQAAHTIQTERHLTANTAGSGFTIKVGGATVGATNRGGGNLLISSGTSTGTASSAIRFLTPVGGASGTADNAPAERGRFHTNGYFGIGSTAPASPLTVAATATDTALTGALVTETITPTANTAATYIGLNVDQTYAATAFNATGASGLWATLLRALNNGTGTVTDLRGIMMTARNQGAGTVTNMYGGAFNGINDATGTVTTMRPGYFGAQQLASGGTIGTLYTLYVDRPSNVAGATIGTTYGLYVVNQTVAAGTQTNAPYGIYQQGTADKNYFAGTIGIGVDPPSARLHLPAGTATASTAPIKLTTGTSLTTPEAGAVEWTTDDLFFTITTGAARKAFILDDGARLTSGKIPIATTNGRLIDGQTPLAGTKTYYVADSSGGAVTRKLTFIDGVLTAET